MAKHKQSRRFLETVGHNFLTQVVEEKTSNGRLFDHVLTDRQGFVADVRAGGSLGYSHHEIQYLAMAKVRAASKNATLQFRRANFQQPSWKNPIGTGPAENMASQYSRTTSSKLKNSSSLRARIIESYRWEKTSFATWITESSC